MEDLLGEKDVLFYENIDNEIELIMEPGNFIVFFPDDIHRPNCNCEKEYQIRKVVVKVNIELF